ncbi:2-amino-4-hydroxy-6-hydroxymethyldihydropteridine diphosphokinase [Corynebacterium sp. TAE3-ERU12]|uniref:2-amino-4-hydroxy-6- hydroxymethyldihydropteridine diphosphokinase n=1 Tax=Corynebacterium sp. TAE3-ERU12 TaxID=2849491 RepID=UPI001C463CCD|nr:2-amino-4-hydroxy-6-hydroxymethyldihydropteridine diphosphokinase [Corynebacterium sp. TAE3-ERU12]MBV7295930.1 2-amino-4-hydroxy-6-hydroxymethyldihydropteridine diphosphokinase [Corynebacterium sp. TAE3-ERU12]
MRAVLSIGGNIGDATQRLREVVEHFGTDLVARSEVYRTPPWGGVEQDDFRNAILIVEVQGTPMELLRRCQALEAAADRTREVRWGPRTLDVDIVDITVGTQQIISTDPVLTLPHPRAHSRAFVLIPWLDADPDAKLGDTPVAQLLDVLPDEERAGIRKLPGAWEAS